MINYTELDFNIRKHKLDCSIYTIKYKYPQDQWKTKLSIIGHTNEKGSRHVMLNFIKKCILHKINYIEHF